MLRRQHKPSALGGSELGKEVTLSTFTCALRGADSKRRFLLALPRFQRDTLSLLKISLQIRTPEHTTRNNSRVDGLGLIHRAAVLSCTPGGFLTG